MQKVIKVDGKDVGFRASALTPRLYRIRIGRDMIVDMNRLKKNYEKVGDDPEARLSVTDLTIFENSAYVNITMTISRIHRTSGWTRLKCFRFMR